MSQKSKFFMVAGLLAVVGMAFRVSWNALRDVASAIGADPTAATVYPLVVDGLMALALVAALVLPEADRRFALRVLAGYTVTSLVLNYVHGLVPSLHGGGRVRLADWAPAHWALVLLASSLPVGSIFFGSDLVAKVLHHKPEPSENTQIAVNRSGDDLPALPDGEADRSVNEPGAGPTVPVPAAEPAEVPAPVVDAVPVRAVAAVVSRPRRATGTLPQSARAARPERSFDDLLAEARSATADWPDDRLKADPIRLAVRTSSAKARLLREALKAERADQSGDAGRSALHAVPATAGPVADSAGHEISDDSEEKAS